MGNRTYCVIAGRSVNDLSWGADEGHADCIALKLIIANKVAELSNKGVKDFYCNAEYGAGLFAGETVVALREALGVRLHVIMSHEEQASRYSKEVRERFFTLHEKADSVEILNAHYYKNCEREADMYMVDNSDILLTDSMDSFIARYADKEDMEIELIERIPSEIL